MVGGYRPDGADGTNELSYLCVEAMNLCQLAEPNFSMRYNRDTPRDLVALAARLIRTDAADSYRNAFDAAGDWNVAEREEDMEAYIAAFDRQLRERLDAQVYERHRNAMAELAHMLDWDNTERPDWESKTAQMSIEDRDKPFQNRWVLPTTREVR